MGGGSVVGLALRLYTSQPPTPARLKVRTTMNVIRTAELRLAGGAAA